MQSASRGFGRTSWCKAALSLVSKLFIDRICEVALALATKTMTATRFHPLIAMFLMSSWYFVVFQLRAFSHCNMCI